MEEIYKQFDERFVKQGIPTGIIAYTNKDGTDITASKIKDFLTTVIAERDKKLVEKLEGENKKILEEDTDNFHLNVNGTVKRTTFTSGRYEALSEAISIIKEFNK